MNIEWKYKIDLEDGAISKVSNKYGIEIPQELQELIKEANAATPSVTRFMVKVDERVLGAVLSFNPDEKEADSFDSAMMMDFEKNKIPFGIDPFGNYICYNSQTGNIEFFDHEQDIFEVVAETLSDFLDMLY